MGARPFRLILFIGILLVGLLGPISGVQAAPPSELAYIVVLKDHVSQAASVAAEHSRKHDARVGSVWSTALKGYSASMSPGAAKRLGSDSRVAYVEPDGIVTASATQTGATWGLDRIDQRDLPLNSTFNYTNDGTGVTAYIIDTGVRLTHNEFKRLDGTSRAVSGWDFVQNDSNASDCNGHGTHVAGTVGGKTYGVAKNVSLVAVRVLNCSGSGTYSQVISGVDWVTGNHQASQPAVANMSLGGGPSTALDDAVRNSIAAGVAYSIAAGNSNADACSYSPARVAEAMTIGATDRSDYRASFSNWGNCVDWFAPGVSITSAWSTNNNKTKTISGTSMASPHTAGVAALYLQTNSAASPATVRDALFGLTTKGIVSNAGSANNHLLFTDL